MAPLMQDHLGATGAEARTIAVAFQSITLAVTQGLWNTLEVLFAAVWWVGIGWTLRTANKGIAWLSVATGLACLLDAKGNLLGLPMMAEIGLNLYLVLAIIWPTAIGIWIMRSASLEQRKKDQAL